MAGQEARTKAMRIAVSVPGVEAASLKGQDKDQIEVKGDDSIDTVKLVTIIRKKFGHAELVSVAEDKKEEKKEEEKKPEVVPLTMRPPSYHVPVSYPIYEPPSCSIM
ncbi:hypothetical protein FH972_014195 [Carpinus fangiana]|uniref:HMA domain-containing protein n=1 Tax=Carpinus fangiana TaxID=176857 RepID=A0A5N6RCF9_9ROSI|nr:hypothetical protein FH972_014195 [Carpinus fangiana]